MPRANPTLLALLLASIPESELRRLAEEQRRARQPAPGRCPGCGVAIGSGDVLCDRCHEQHPGHRPDPDPLDPDFIELARSFGD